MIEHRYLLSVCEYDEPDIFRGNNSYELRMELAPRARWIPPEPERSYRRGDMVMTTSMFSLTQRDPDEIIVIPATPGRWVVDPPRYDVGVLVDWVERTATEWDVDHGWSLPVPLIDWLQRGLWRL